MIIIAGYLEFADQAGRDGVVAASLDHQQATRDDEPGCVAYVFSADPCDGRRVQIYEAWRDESSLAAHFEHPNYSNMREVLRMAERTGGDILKHRVDLSEPVYDENRVARADFFTATD